MTDENKSLAAGLKDSTNWVTFTAAVWLTVVTIVVTKGIKHASYAQLILTVVETGIVLALVIGAFVQYSAHPAHAPAFSWLTDFTPATFATGALTAIFSLLGLGRHHEPGRRNQGRYPPTRRARRLLAHDQFDAFLHHHDHRGLAGAE